MDGAGLVYAIQVFWLPALCGVRGSCELREQLPLTPPCVQARRARSVVRSSSVQLVRLSVGWCRLRRAGLPRAGSA